MLVHIDFVEPTSIRLVSFKILMQNQLILHGFFYYLYIYNFQLFILILLKHLLQVYYLFIVLLIWIVGVD